MKLFQISLITWWERRNFFSISFGGALGLSKLSFYLLIFENILFSFHFHFDNILFSTFPDLVNYEAWSAIAITMVTSHHWALGCDGPKLFQIHPVTTWRIHACSVMEKNVLILTWGWDMIIPETQSSSVIECE